MSEYPTGRMKANLSADGVLYYSFPALDAYAAAGLRHGFSTRLGGVSGGARAALNLGVNNGDDQPTVRENYRRFGAALGVDMDGSVLSLQTHGAAIRRVTAADRGKGLLRPRDYTAIDGLITDALHTPLVTHHADCAPLFFYAPPAARPAVIAVAHAGWRGTVARIGAAMVREFAAYGVPPEQIVAAIGPSAGPCCYQVGREVAEQFAAVRDEAGGMCAADGTGRFLLDLWRANRQILLEAGLLAEHIIIGGLCTICNPQLFYSHRLQGAERGSMAACICLDDNRAQGVRA
ncbi:MAG: peptidoglycan editing factor PgeF [Bacillota bacterium]|nr:peptidoglycan editing factor PgeF [Bacillota bacterium]